ncbi:MAG: YggS family pyridoxal phosphate-dependent enzyme [Candidatus Omnitrophica bacterium]|nr:YggS family pyridoxal phosphate-dependent enzyme [Candidatus Omnitrophota bacterium]
MICDNVSIVLGKIRQACQNSGRDPEAVTLVCVAKNRSLEEINTAIGCGITDIAENKVQEAKSKYKSLELMKWHMIGHLQTNKTRDAVKIFDLIHSLDSIRLAKELDKEAIKLNKVQEVLIEVNTSGEEAKFGVAPDGLMDLVKDTVNLKNIRLAGLMTVAPIVDDKENVRPYFKALRLLQSEVNNFLLTIDHRPLTIISMGMSQDYEVAVEEGATMVRIGTAIFEGQKL